MKSEVGSLWPQNYVGLLISFNSLMPGGNKNVTLTYLSMTFLLPPGIKGLMNLFKEI